MVVPMQSKLADRIKQREESVRTRMLNIASKLDDVIALGRGDHNDNFIRISLLQPFERIEQAIDRMAGTVTALVGR